MASEFQDAELVDLPETNQQPPSTQSHGTDTQQPSDFAQEPDAAASDAADQSGAGTLNEDASVGSTTLAGDIVGADDGGSADAEAAATEAAPPSPADASQNAAAVAAAPEKVVHGDSEEPHAAAPSTEEAQASHASTATAASGQDSPEPSAAEAAHAPGPAAAKGEGAPAPGATTPPEAAVPAPTPLFAQGLRAINVEVDMGPGRSHRMLLVIIDLNDMEHKPYLGGFRNRRTGATYHHACTQTFKAPKYSIEERKLSRETQTMDTKARGAQTWREQGTQMERPGLMLDSSDDRVVVPGPYTSSQTVLANRLRATITIQRYTRGWFARRNASYLQQKKQERETFLQELESIRMQEAENMRQAEIQRRIQPKTAADFEILYNELEAWRLQEARRIKESCATPEQCAAALQLLLQRETKLLQTIDRLKLAANQEQKQERIQHRLRGMAQPKTWHISNGKKVAVHTPFTTRAQELAQLYNGLLLTDLSLEQRLDVLLHVKWTVKEFDCNLTRELVGLIEREADLLNRGRVAQSLEGLRKRIASLFLAFVETSEFNPEAAKLDVLAQRAKDAYEFAQLDPARARAMLPKTSAPLRA